jgi:hypothetical protein
LETPAVTVRTTVFTRDVGRGLEMGRSEPVEAWHCLCFSSIAGVFSGATGARLRRRESAMLRMRNKYCSNCLKTQRFLDLGNCLVCERCSKRLDCVVPAPERADARIVAFVERAEPRREAM